MATEEKDLEKTIAEDLVVTKYKLAGEIVNSELKNLQFAKKHILLLQTLILGLDRMRDICSFSGIITPSTQ